MQKMVGVWSSVLTYVMTTGCWVSGWVICGLWVSGKWSVGQWAGGFNKTCGLI